MHGARISIVLPTTTTSFRFLLFYTAFLTRDDGTCNNEVNAFLAANGFSKPRGGLGACSGYIFNFTSRLFFTLLFSPRRIFSPVPSSFFRVSSFKRVYSVSNGVATSANLTRVTRECNQTKPSSFYVKPVIKSKKKYYTLEYRRNDNFGISSLRFPPLSRTIFRFRFFSIEKPSPSLFSLLHRIDNARSLSHF